MNGPVFQILDDNIVGTWEGIGVTEIETKLMSSKRPKDGDVDVNKIMYEMVWSVLKGRLKHRQICKFFKTNAKLSENRAMMEKLVDIVWVVGQEVAFAEKRDEKHQSEEWKSLCTLVQAISSNALVSQDYLKSVLELEMVHGSLGMDNGLTHTQVIRTNTRLLYTQQKYNLLREESEGFSKLLSLLNSGLTTENVDAIKKDMFALIGYFDLDPNRVCDLVLDVYEENINNDCFINLLQSFKAESLSHLLGFKFQYHQREEAEDPAPQSLYQLAATLLANDLVQLQDVLTHLTPQPKQAIQDHEDRVKKIKQTARSFGVINLSKSTESTNDDSDASNEEVYGDPKNQVYGLLQALFSTGNWTASMSLLNCFKLDGVDPVDHAPIAIAVCRLIKRRIESLYATLSKAKHGIALSSDATVDPVALPPVKPVTTYGEFVEVVFPMLEVLGQQLHHDLLLFVMICRLLEDLMSNMEETDALMSQIDDVLVKCVLPSLCKVSCNPGLCYAIWNLMKSMPYQRRYRLYERWNAQYSSYRLALTKARVIKQTRAILRRLTTDNVGKVSCQLITVAHSNPLIVFSTILGQIEAYDNLIQPVVDSLKFLTSFGMDVLSYTLICNLSSEREKMKPDGTNICLWLSSLAQFCGNTYRKYPNIELIGLLEYIAQRLRQWESVDLLVLGQLLSKMGSCLLLEEISEGQLEARAGGRTLGLENVVHSNKRSIPRLRDALVKQKLLIPFIILMGQQRTYIEGRTETSHLKLIGRLYDTCQMTWSQLYDFISSSIDPAIVMESLPSLERLCKAYHLPFDLALSVCRPVMRACDPILRLDNPLQETEKWNPYGESLLGEIKQLFPEHVMEHMTPTLFSTFWSLTIYDIYIPHARYDSEIHRMRNEYAKLGSMDVRNLSDSEAKEKRAKEKKLKVLIDALLDEQQKQVKHRRKVHERLEKQKSEFISEKGPNSFVEQYLEKCVLPRALLTPEDALFAARFSEFMHSINTPGFNSIGYYHTVTNAVPSMVLCITEREAANLGVFLNDTLSVLYRWYNSAHEYKKEALNGRHGFALDLKDPEKSLLSYSEFRKVMHNLHRSIEKVFIMSLQSTEYMSIRNSLKVLSKIVNVFPATRKSAEALEPIVDKLTKEDREDLKVMATRYDALLKKKKKTLKDETSSTETTSAGKSRSSSSSKTTSTNGKSAGASKSSSPPTKSSSSTTKRTASSSDQSASSKTDDPKETKKEVPMKRESPVKREPPAKKESPVKKESVRDIAAARAKSRDTTATGGDSGTRRRSKESDEKDNASKKRPRDDGSESSSRKRREVDSNATSTGTSSDYRRRRDRDDYRRRDRSPSSRNDSNRDSRRNINRDDQRQSRRNRR